MKRVLVAAIALSTLLGSAAMADSDDRDRGRHERHESNRRDNHRPDGRHNERRDYRGGRHDDRRAAQRHDRDDRRWNGRDWDDRDDDDRRWDRRQRDNHRSFYRPDRYGYDHHNRYRVSRYYRPHGYRHYVWHNGARLPPAYYAPRYVVHDYGAYRLRHPPHGYHWVRVDNDVLLAAIATGVVVQVVNGLFYY